MRNRSLLAAFFSLFFSFAQAQPTTAMDFTMDDCNGNMRHLYGTLDSNHVVILEFFMNCPPCVAAGQEMTPMHSQLSAEFPGKVHFYEFAFNNYMTCPTITNWMANNGIVAVPFDSGAAQITYYGGFGMPTIVVAAGTQHTVLHTNMGWTPGDTAAIAAAVRNFFNTIGIEESPALSGEMNVFPSPAKQNVQLRFELKRAASPVLRIMNPLGQTLREFKPGEKTAGTHTINLFIGDLPAGAYFVQLSAGEAVLTKRFVIAE